MASHGAARAEGESGRAARNRYAFTQLTGGPVTIPSYTGVATGAVAAACLAACCAAPPVRLVCPYAPWYQHAYRHGTVATRETQQRMQAWYASHAASPVPNVLSFHGGAPSGQPRGRGHTPCRVPPRLAPGAAPAGLPHPRRLLRVAQFHPLCVRGHRVREPAVRVGPGDALRRELRQPRPRRRPRWL